jgi:DNA polymerase-3 subunit epsilon
MERAVILDIETTGLYVDEGEKIVSVGMIEVIDGKPTGKTYYGCFNPGRDSNPHALAVHRLTTEFLKTKPAFATAAQTIRDFIGDAPIIITCRTSERHGKPYTLDEAFITAEMTAAGVTPPLAGQWVNIRRLSEEMFGQDGARLDAVLDRYGINRAEREKKGHDALLDARLLADVYPLIKADYAAFTQKAAANKSAPKL